jgi:enoyl-CoA hydratase
VTDLDVARSGAVLTLTLDRPDQLNALTDELADALAGELEAAAAYDDVRVVVLRGAGRAFCAGADIVGAEAPMQLDVRALDRANRIVRAITRLDKPVLAAVHGPAAGVGCSIALADARRRLERLGGGVDRTRPGDADGPARRSAVGP